MLTNQKRLDICFMLEESQQKEVDLEIQKIIKPLSVSKSNGKDKVKSLEGLINLTKTFKQDCVFISNKEELVKWFEKKITKKTSLRPLLWHRTSYMRAATIRCLKYLVSKELELSPVLWKFKCHYFLFRFLFFFFNFFLEFSTMEKKRKKKKDNY
jgi:hypothetical protein